MSLTADGVSRLSPKELQREGTLKDGVMRELGYNMLRLLQ